MKTILPALFFISTLCGTAAAADLPAFGPADRILVVAPHPDDEALGAAGWIQRAVESGADVRVVYLTHGDDNEMSSLFFFKKPILTKANLLRIGDLRENESETAMQHLDIPDKKLIFLGYPDGGALSIWRKRWGSARPYKNLLTETDKVPYEGDPSYGSPYKGESVQKDMRRVFEEYRPTHIFVTVPFDKHADHRAAYLFTQLALLDLDAAIPRPALFGYVIHARRWPRPRAYKPGKPLAAPDAGTPEGDAGWVRFPLTETEITVKKEAITRYTSQMTYSKKFLLSFVRTNELFLPLTQENPKQGAPDEEVSPPAQTKGRSRDKRPPSRVDYYLKGPDLWIDVHLDTALDEIGGLGVELYPYRHDRDFSGMPKLALRFFGKRFFASDALGRAKPTEIFFRTLPNRYQIRVPLALLGDPEHVFVSVSAAKRETTPDFNSWKLLEIIRT